ncbi:rCG22957 [Rattus norvegicus]|uniref:RCG22957 n=1 Tax=Rattus norvegicus TaxID=10116 RepID=A6KB39_RAT|nr:rCG22957 [Rattus norvegicus]
MWCLGISPSTIIFRFIYRIQEKGFWYPFHVTLQVEVCLQSESRVSPSCAGCEQP